MPDLSKGYELNEPGFRALPRDPAFVRELQRLTDRVVTRPAQIRAPKRTGFGASTIHSELDVEEFRVSWSREAYYLRFHELGTKHLPARPFLEPGIDL